MATVLSLLPSRAAAIAYTDRNSFLASLSSSSTDNYNNLAASYVPSPLTRSIPGYGYNANGSILLASDYGSKILWNSIDADFLGINNAFRGFDADILKLNFTAGAPTAAGGYFFGWDSANPAYDVITVTVYPGANEQSVLASSSTNFFG